MASIPIDFKVNRELSTVQDQASEEEVLDVLEEMPILMRFPCGLHSCLSKFFLSEMPLMEEQLTRSVTALRSIVV